MGIPFLASQIDGRKCCAAGEEDHVRLRTMIERIHAAALPLFVVFTIRRKLIRMISVRDMNRKESTVYQTL